MPEAVGLHLVVADLADDLRSDGGPVQLLPAAPTALSTRGPPDTEMGLMGTGAGLDERREPLLEILLQRAGDAGGMTDKVERAVIVLQAWPERRRAWPPGGGSLLPRSLGVGAGPAQAPPPRFGMGQRQADVSVRRKLKGADRTGSGTHDGGRTGQCNGPAASKAKYCSPQAAWGRRVSPATPATPPDKRVRIRRFEELRSRAEPREPKVGEELVRQSGV